MRSAATRVSGNLEGPSEPGESYRLAGGPDARDHRIDAITLAAAAAHNVYGARGRRDAPASNACAGIVPGRLGYIRFRRGLRAAGVRRIPIGRRGAQRCQIKIRAARRHVKRCRRDSIDRQTVNRRVRRCKIGIVAAGRPAVAARNNHGDSLRRSLLPKQAEEEMVPSGAQGPLRNRPGFPAHHRRARGCCPRYTQRPGPLRRTFRCFPQSRNQSWRSAPALPTIRRPDPPLFPSPPISNPGSGPSRITFWQVRGGQPEYSWRNCFTPIGRPGILHKLVLGPGELKQYKSPNRPQGQSACPRFPLTQRLVSTFAGML